MRLVQVSVSVSGFGSGFGFRFRFQVSVLGFIKMDFPDRFQFLLEKNQVFMVGRLSVNLVSFVPYGGGGVANCCLPQVLIIECRQYCCRLVPFEGDIMHSEWPNLLLSSFLLTPSSPPPHLLTMSTPTLVEVDLRYLGCVWAVIIVRFKFHI